jgi:hypothetical protein
MFSVLEALLFLHAFDERVFVFLFFICFIDAAFLIFFLLLQDVHLFHALLSVFVLFPAGLGSVAGGFAKATA